MIACLELTPAALAVRSFKMAALEQLRKDREHLQFILSLEMAADYRALFAALLFDIEKEISEVEPRPN
jgi:hypothetical protein